MASLKQRILLLWITSILSLLSACSDSTPATYKENTKPHSGETIEFLNSQFTIFKPKQWKTMKGLNNKASLQMGSEAEEAYAMVFTEPKTDFDGVSLQDFSNLTRNILKNNLNHFEETKPKKMNIHGYPAIQYTITGSRHHLKLKYWHVSIKTKDHFHQVVTWSIPSKFDKNKATYKQIIHSFNAK